MVIYMIWAMRKGESTPELLDAIDEPSHDENPSWVEERLEEHQQNPDLEAIKLFRIRCGSDFDHRLNELLARDVDMTILSGDITEVEKG